jgi:hypothetical protein
MARAEQVIDDKDLYIANYYILLYIIYIITCQILLFTCQILLFTCQILLFTCQILLFTCQILLFLAKYYFLLAKLFPNCYLPIIDDKGLTNASSKPGLKIRRTSWPNKLLLYWLVIIAQST